MFENPFAKNLRGYPRRNEYKYILDNNTIRVDDSKNIFFNKISLDKRMDDYEYEKKYLKFVKEMKLKIGNFVEFEPELRKKRRVVKENNFLNKIGFNCVLPRKTIKNTTSNSNKSTDNNINLNFNKFLCLQNNIIKNQNILNIQDQIFTPFFNNKNPTGHHKESFANNHNEFQTISKDEEKLKTVRSYKDTDDNEKIRQKHKKEYEMKNLCNLKSFRELLMKSNSSLNKNVSNDNINLNRISTGMTARKFLNRKYSNFNKNKTSSTDFFITNNNKNQLNPDQFSKTQNNFRIDDESKKNTQFFSSTPNTNFFKLNKKDDENCKQANIRPESNRTHYQLGIKNDQFKNDYGLTNKNDLNKRFFFSKKDNLKIHIDKDNISLPNHNISNKNISTQSINFKNFTANHTNCKFNFSENTITKGNKISTNFKSKETNTDLDPAKNTLIKNVQILDNIQNKVNLRLNKIPIHLLSPKAEEKINNDKTSNFNIYKDSCCLKKTDNDSNVDNSRLSNSIYATPKRKRNFSAKELYNKLSDRKGPFHKELRAISFHNSSIQRDASGKWYNPTKKIKRKFLMKEVNDERIEDKEDVVLPKHDKRDKDFIKSPDDNIADKKIYFIEKNKANMINHINTISRMTDENYMKYGYFLENKYDFYAHQVDIPEYIFASARYRPKTNTRDIDRRTSNIKIVFENILKVKSRILNVKPKEDSKQAAKN